jgi:NAD(P)-dependent dehydrogenase (short-subunit alcohol dehydrogenase family)
VTGAGRGIGRQIALMYVAQGAQVIACDIDASALAKLAKESDFITPHTADLTLENSGQTLADLAERKFGAVDILVNAAAIVKFGWIDTLSTQDWHTTIKGEIDTVFLVTRAMWPLLEASGQSAIINFGSANAHVALQGLPAIAHTAGKGAVMAMTRQMAMEGGPKGIRANSIAPGFTVTEETEQHLDTPLMDNVRDKLMVGRLGTTTDIGHLAIYLGSDESGYVTGADFCIDGGATAW